ncbi:MAG: lysozyme inhibitor LprI family protein [Pseudomonadota bacterium]
MRTPIAAFAITAALCFLVFAGLAEAQTADCDTAQSTPEINACLEAQLQISDDALNDAYQLARREIDAADWLDGETREDWKIALRDAQRLWIQYRDADCMDTVPYEWGGGTGTTSGILICLITKTDTRTEELRARYETN